MALPRALEPGSPQQGIDIFSFPQALGLAGVRPRYRVGGEWLVDTRVAFCKSKLCPFDNGLPGPGSELSCFVHSMFTEGSLCSGLDRRDITKYKRVHGDLWTGMYTHHIF